MRLSSRLAIIVATSVALITIPSAIGLYYYYQDKLLDKEAKALQGDTDINIANVFRPILQEEAKLNFLSRLLEEELAAPAERYEVKQFDEMMQHDADGVWRSKPETMDAAKSAGIFLPPDAKLDEKQKILHLRSKKIIDAAAFGLNSYFTNLWLITHDKTEVISDELVPDFIMQMRADTDYTKTAWMTLGDPVTNPLREMRWTKASYDPVQKNWLISAVKPVDVEGVWIGNVGQDMLLQNMFATLFKKTQRYRGELFFLLDKHGNYLHAGPWQQTLEANPDKFKLDFSQAPLLEKLFKQKVESSALVFDRQVSIKGKKYLAISTKITPTGWRYYRLVSVAEILAPLNKLFMLMGVVLTSMGLLMGFLIHKAIQKTILSRIQTLAGKVYKQESANFSTKTRLALTGNADASLTINPEMEDDIYLASQGFDIALVQLKESERELQLLMDNIPGTVARVNRELRYEYVNKNYELVFGKQPKWIVGHTMQELQGEAMFKLAEPYVQRALAGERCSYERVAHTPSGEALTGLVHLIPNKDEDEQVIGFFVIGLDVTQVKKAEAEIETSRNLLKTIIDIAPVQIFWKDSNSRYMGGNTAFAKDAKLNSSEDLIGKFDTDLLWKDSAEKFQQEDREIIESGIAKLNYEHMLVRPNGETTWARSSKVPLKNLNGEIIGVLGVDEDITERKQLEDERLEAQKRFEKIAQNVPGIVYQFLLRKDGSSCFPYASEAIGYIFRVSPEEVREDASKVFAMLHPNDHDDVVTSIQISAKDLTLWREEFRVRYEDGTERWLYGNSSPDLQENGDVLWHGFITDITEQKKIEVDAAESRTLLKTIIDITPIQVFWKDVDSRYIGCNKAFANAAGVETTADVIGKDDTQFEWASEVKRYRADDSAVMKSGIPKLSYEQSFVSSDGQRKWGRTSKVQLKNQNNETIGLLGIHEDITKQKQIEQELAESEHRWKYALEGAGDAVWDCDEVSHIMFYSKAWKEMLGYSEEEITDSFEEWESRIHPEDKKATLVAAQDCLDGKTASYRHEYRSRCKDGSYIWVQDRGTVVSRSEDGTALRMIGTVSDISERKQVQAALLASESHLRAIIDNEPACIKIMDAHGRLRQMNPAGLAMIEADSLDQVVGRPLSDVIVPEYRKAFAELHERVIAGESMQLEFEVLGLKGGRRWLETHAVPMVEDGENVLLAVTRDVTDRKQAEEALRDSEYRWKFAIEGSGDGVWDVNVQTQEATYSKRWKEMLGLETEKLTNNRQEWISRIHPDDRANVLDAGQAYLEGKRDAYVVEYRLQCKDGGYKWMLSRGMLVSRDEAGNPLRMIGTQTDISERKSAEQMIQKAQAELEESHDKFKDLYEFAPIGYLTISRHGLITQLNWRASAMLASDRKNIINQRITQFIDESDKARWTRMFSNIKELNPSEELSFDLKFILHNGMSFYANLNCIRMDDEDEQSMLRVTLEDITMVKNSEIDLRIAATAFESQDGLMITDSENRILKVNKAFTDITGYTDAELIGKNPSILSSGRHDAAFFDAMWESINKTGRWSGEIWNRRKSGDVYPESLTISTVKNDLGVITNYVGANADISQIKAATEEIQQLAFFDSLTHLPNRRLLMDRLKHALAACARSGRQGAVLFLDLDHFKVLNDSLGHDIGDLLLQQVATRLTACVREGDTVARLGGDEYVVVLEDLSDQGFEGAAQTEIIANKILAALNQPYELDVHEHHITPSIGITVFDGHSATIEELLKQADIAMYQAKKAGRNTMRFFNPQMQTSITARVAIERELRKALENKQLHLHYQVQVDNLGHPLGAEALIRWIHPERGLVSPVQFIPLAEETGLILPIGNWVLDTACAQIKEWHQNPLTRDLTLSINVSAKQFRQADFVEQVRTAIERHAIDPMQLKLELTESILVDNIEEIIVSMTALGEIGVQFSLDDFGTGYSSLQYLKRLPLFQLKIDQSFVRDIVTDSHDRSIVRTIIAMAQSLYLNVIAEGVETEEQRALLLSNGCKRYQGYLFSKPVPIEQFEAVLSQITAKVSSKTNEEHI